MYNREMPIPKVSILVPAFNEEKQIGNLLAVLVNTEQDNEIICINDGSTDNTEKEIRKFKGRVKLISLARNRGKGYAISKGVKAAKNDIVVFIDADILGFQDKHVRQLVSPLLKKTHDGVIGCFTDKADKFFAPLMGQRAYYKKDLLPYLGEIKKKGYGLELYLNYIFAHKKIKTCKLRGTSNLLKHQKQSYDTAARLFLVELFDVGAELINQRNSFSDFIKQYFFLEKGKTKQLDNRIKKLMNYIRIELIDKLIP